LVNKNIPERGRQNRVRLPCWPAALLLSAVILASLLPCCGGVIRFAFLGLETWRKKLARRRSGAAGAPNWRVFAVEERQVHDRISKARLYTLAIMRKDLFRAAHR
jgi:hypothetical protein